MPDATRETTERPGQARSARQPYSSPRLEVLGSLRRATRGSGGMGADGALGMTRMSDRRAKEDIVEIGRHPLGLGIYRFRYTSRYSMKYGRQRSVGVMADEVAVDTRSPCPVTPTAILWWITACFSGKPRTLAATLRGARTILVLGSLGLGRISS